MVDFKIVIPARHASTRLPGKPLLDIAGRPMIYHVCERGLEAGASEVVLATDDERIAEAVADLPVKAVMTSPDHHSGTERIKEAADIMGWNDETIVVNLQGDEPFIPPDFPWLRHIGVYAYSVVFLHRYVAWPPTALEAIESLEQLRILWMGEKILVMPVDSAPEAGVDTEEDLHRVRARFETAGE